ncbi:hypothetical protein VD0002_g685 [Verticillium dahliae]|uniref:Translation initiation factor 3 C-terminal domain-containing protein n=2 Tax=Verticillium dahliae TaxID=27337 RepID=G2XGI4_VERDV|nr:uncharacterized protein VDAG_09266 [Verticillium dahliae VdLs.17]KAF3346917.1 Gamma-butyrobetaine dioxygenase [Verticillium dahliae VDG2]KAH6692941.1 hypothetical protein EV126DRAFT_428850 [Verticillium dahliae]EGY18932.1 hypothetical protein VDAG_09266 [Verticillium dahliae VdLs.17]PNH30576.1 hypothetical protein BJF96_g6155 [Verticillium dahliae]PNH69815.1 hypothetical protein VD0002_g685 [Verticillium dahliae]
MKTARCVYNSQSALYRVFVSPLESLQSKLASRSLALASAHARKNGSPPITRPSAIRTLSTTRFLSAPPRPSGPTGPGGRRGKVAPDRLPQDLEIKDKKIMLVDDATGIKGPFLTRAIIEDLEEGYSLRMIKAATPPDPKKPSADGQAAKARPARAEVPFALCRIVHAQEERLRLLAQAKEKKARERQAGKLKEIELNWAIAANDLAIRMGKLKDFLGKGWRVDVTLAKKKGSRKATQEEMAAVVKAVGAAVAEVPGARERKAREGELGKSFRIYVEGVAPKEEVKVKGKAKAEAEATPKEAQEGAES